MSGRKLKPLVFEWMEGRFELRVNPDDHSNIEFHLIGYEQDADAGDQPARGMQTDEIRYNLYEADIVRLMGWVVSYMSGVRP